jgi:hypothetical protein
VPEGRHGWPAGLQSWGKERRDLHCVLQEQCTEKWLGAEPAGGWEGQSQGPNFCWGAEKVSLRRVPESLCG